MSRTLHLAACAWHLAWHQGVWRALAEERLADTFTTIGGASSGSFSAIAFAARLPIDLYDSEADRLASATPGLRSWGRMSAIVGGAIDDHFRDPSHPGWYTRGYVVITRASATDGWPYLGTHFVDLPPYHDHARVKDLVLSSCYIPGVYEKPTRFDGRRTLDGGTFLGEVALPGVVTSSPWHDMSPTCIGWERGSRDERRVREDWRYNAVSLLPNVDFMRRLREAGYRSARTWAARHG